MELVASMIHLPESRQSYEEIERLVHFTAGVKPQSFIGKASEAVAAFNADAQDAREA